MKYLNSLLISSPHGRSGLTTHKVMRTVALATLPGLLVQGYWFGWGVLVQVLLCCTVALMAEAIVLSLRERPVRNTLMDGSAFLTGLLIALSIPPYAPWWVAVIGTLFAIIVAKQLYGGLGFNLFNPAMVAYVVLLISFPVAMTSWLPPLTLQSLPVNFTDALYTIFTGYSVDGYSLSQLRLSADGVTMATPLDHFKLQHSQGFAASEIMQSPVYGDFGGIGWQWVNLAYLLGGLYLLKTGLIRWHIPVALLTSLTVCFLLAEGFAPDQQLNPLLHLFSGATMFAAFFIATDPVSASTTAKGRLIYGAFIGVMIFIIRYWGGYPDGVAFAVLLANMCVPFIDHYTQPIVYGHRKGTRS